MKPVRRLMQQLQNIELPPAPLPPHPPNTKKQSLGIGRKGEQFDINGMLKADPVTFEDIMSALQTTKSSSSDGDMMK